MGIFDGLRSLFGTNSYYIASPDVSDHVLDLAYEDIYRSQANLRAVVSFLADNVAELPMKVYDRRSDTDRERLTDDVAALLLKRPNPDQTRYEMIRQTVSDLLIYDRCIWLVLEDETAQSGWQVRPIPPSWVISYHGGSAFAPESIDVCPRNGGSPVNVPASKFVLFHGYNPTDPARQCSPIESLRQTITEQVEADRYRTQVWKRGGRMSAYISRPKDVEPWSAEQANRFRQGWRKAWQGDAADQGGGMPVLEDGMEIRSTTFNAKEADWATAKKLSREDVAAAYHVNPSIIWHTDGATYASAKDNARALYSETLAPIIAQITERVNAFLLPMIGACHRTYVEMDISAKLQASFEEQASVLYTSVGRPWLTANEARARQNLPAMEGGDVLAVPLNMGTGSDDQQEEPKSSRTAAKSGPVHIKAHPLEEDGERLSEVLKSYFERQARSVLPKIGGGGDWYDDERWNRELADDLEGVLFDMASRNGHATARRISSEFADAKIAAYIRKMAEKRAEGVNLLTYKRLLASIAESGEQQETPRDVFDDLAETRSATFGASMAAAVVGWSALEAVRQAGQEAQGATKTWVVTSDNPRASHAAMDGETVPYGETFSNGMEWPGSYTGDPAETCGCRCEIEITIP